MFVTDQDLAMLTQLREVDDHGVHFTDRYAVSWLDRMEDAGLIQVWKPIECFFPAQTSEWKIRLTSLGRSILIQ